KPVRLHVLIVEVLLHELLFEFEMAYRYRERDGAGRRGKYTGYVPVRGGYVFDGSIGEERYNAIFGYVALRKSVADCRQQQQRRKNNAHGNSPYVNGRDPFVDHTVEGRLQLPCR